NESNDVFSLLKENKIDFARMNTLDKKSIEKMPKHSSILVVADSYPAKKVSITAGLYQEIEKRSIRLYIEYPEQFPNQRTYTDSLHVGSLERAVVTANMFGEALPPMTILGINDCHLIPIQHERPIMVYAKVAGFDKAEYGLSDTKSFPLLYQDDDMLVCTSSLSNFAKGRFSPNQSWQIV